MNSRFRSVEPSRLGCHPDSDATTPLLHAVLPAWVSAWLVLTLLSAAASAAPPAPSQPVASCDAIVDGRCYVDGSFTLTATSPGAAYYRICRSNDTTGWGGCNHVITFNSGSTITVTGSHLPGEGFRRAYRFSACDANNSCSNWADNDEVYVQMDTTGPTAPGPSTVSCAQNGGECWAQGSFNVSVSAATDLGSGVSIYDFCRSNDSSGGFAGCEATMAQISSATFTVVGSNLPSPGSRRAYWVRAKDHLGNPGPWNTPRYVRVDAYNPVASANNASTEVFSSRTATVSANDEAGGAATNSGLTETRFRWNSPLNAACTDGTITSNGAVLDVPTGDNYLYLCAKDVAGRIGRWTGGPYRVGEPPSCPIAGFVEPKACDDPLATAETIKRKKIGTAPLSDFALHEALYDHFLNYDMATVDSAALRRNVDTTGTMQLSLAGRSHELILEPVEIRAPSYVATEVGADGETELPRQPVSTFRGHVSGEPESDVRLFISSKLMMGYVKVGDRRFFIDPAYRYAEGGGTHRLVIYEEGDQRDTEGVSCGMAETHRRAQDLVRDLQLDSALLNASKNSSLREMEVAVDVDAEYYGEHQNYTNGHILSVINAVNGLYQELNLELTVVNTRIFTDAATDPYETCNVFGQWCEMWEEWNTHRTHVRRDLAHLFSGKRLYQSDTLRARGTAGVWGTVCNPSLAFTTSTPYLESDLVAHEMGHALNAEHVEEDFPSLCPDRDCLLDCEPNQPCDVDTCPNETPEVGGPVMCGSIQRPITGFGPSLGVISEFINGPGDACLRELQVSTAIYPWQDNANGTLSFDASWHLAVGYHFTPQVSGQITELGGLFNGTKTVKLFNKSTGALLAESTVTGNNTWRYSSIAPVEVQAGTTYTVAVYLAGSGGSSRNRIARLPRTYGDIRIEASTYVNTSGNPNARPTSSQFRVMRGQADFRFVPN